MIQTQVQLGHFTEAYHRFLPKEEQNDDVTQTFLPLVVEKYQPLFEVVPAVLRTHAVYVDTIAEYLGFRTSISRVSALEKQMKYTLAQDGITSPNITHVKTTRAMACMVACQEARVYCQASNEYDYYVFIQRVTSLWGRMNLTIVGTESYFLSSQSPKLGKFFVNEHYSLFNCPRPPYPVSVQELHVDMLVVPCKNKQVDVNHVHLFHNLIYSIPPALAPWTRPNSSREPRNFRDAVAMDNAQKQFMKTHRDSLPELMATRIAQHEQALTTMNSLTPKLATTMKQLDGPNSRS